MANYITQLEENKDAMQLFENEIMTLRRFRRGLNDNHRKDLILSEVITLDHV